MRAQLVKFMENLTPSQLKLMHERERLAAREAGGKLIDAMPQLVDPVQNGGERLGGGLLGWVLELGTRYALDRIGAPAADGSQNFIGKHLEVSKGIASGVIGIGGMVVNLAIPGSPERSMGRRLLLNASTSHALFAADRLATHLIPSLPK